jgi:ribonuclease Z
MRPILHPSLVNGRFGDPVLAIETLFEKRIILFDLGSIEALSAHQIQRIGQVFISHCHMDHFIGFDRLLRTLVGREKTIGFYGPPGFACRLSHKLQGYSWNLADRYLCDLVFVVTEIDAGFETQSLTFRLKNGFAPEAGSAGKAEEGILHAEPMFRVRTRVLDHRIACLAFAIEEARHVNIWKNRLADRGLPVGPWLRDLKRAVINDEPDDYPINIPVGAGKTNLGGLRDIFTAVPGQKIGYVTDVADTPANRAAILELVEDADLLFIEAVFSAADRNRAADRAHLTTIAAGEIARAAKVRRVEPFHFSPRYQGEEDRLLDEVQSAFVRRL